MEELQQPLPSSVKSDNEWRRTDLGISACYLHLSLFNKAIEKTCKVADL